MTIYVQVSVDTQWMQKGGWDEAIKNFAYTHPKIKFKIAGASWGYNSGALLCFEDEKQFTKFALLWVSGFRVIPNDTVEIRYFTQLLP